MNIRKTIITTAVALTTVAMIAPMSVGAVTTAELQAQINALMAQLQALQGSSDTGGVPAACVGLTFTRNLTVGSTGSDVKCLQALMNTSVSTQVAVSGAGSPGSETMYFGNLTLVAVKKYQAAQGWTPANQVGPLTRAKLNAWLGGSTPTPTPTPGPTPTPTPTGAGMTVSLASDNPAAGSVVGVTGSGSALNPMLKLTFWNGDNAEVSVTGLKLKRVGIAADASLTNTYLFDGATRLTDGAAVSETIVNFNSSVGLFKVPANGSKTISVLANIDGSASETVGFQVVEMASVTSNASSVKGTFPITGNLMTIAAGTLAGVEWNATTTPDTADVDPQDGYTVFQNSVIVTTRAVDLTRISFRKTGSTSNTDLQNFKLYVDGVQLGSTTQLAQNSNGDWYATFDLAGAPKRLETGTRVVKVLADIVGGATLTFTTSLWNVADVTVVDSQYNANVLSDLVSDAFSKRSSGVQTINGGTVTFTKMTDSPSGDIIDASSNALLGKWEVKAAGEKVKIETLNIRIIFTDVTGTNDNATETFRNGALYANGVQIGSTTSTTSAAAGTQFSLGSSLIVVPGSPVILTFRADVFDNSSANNDVDATDTFQATIVGSSTNNNATGQVSANTIDAPASNVNANVLTNRVGGLTLSKYTAYTNQTAVVPLTAYKLGHFTLTANTTEAVNVSTIEVGLNYVSGNANNLYVKFGTNTTSVKPTVAVANTWSVNYSLPAGQTVDVMVYGDVNSTAVGEAVTGMYVAGTTANSAISVTQGTTPQVGGSTIAGQTITFSSGVATTAVDGSTPLAQAVAGNQSVVAGKFKLTAQNDSYTIKEVRFTASPVTTSNAIKAATSAVISSVTVKDGSTVLGTQTYDGTNNYWNFTGLSTSVPANTTKVLTVEYNLATPYTDGSGTTAATTATSGRAPTLTLSYMKVANSQGTESEPTAARVANYTYVYKTVPTFTNVTVTGQGGNLTSGSPVTLMTFKVAANAKGPVALKQIKFNTNITDGGTASAPTMNTFTFFRGSTNITTSVTIRDSGGTSLEGTTTSLDENNSSDVYVVFDTEEIVSAGAENTYTLKGTPTGFIGVAGDSDTVVCSIDQDTSGAGVAVGETNTKMALDATATSTIQTLSATALQAGTGTSANVIWSDNSAVLHDYTYTGSSFDWFNGYLLDNLPLNGNTITYSN